MKKLYVFLCIILLVISCIKSSDKTVSGKIESEKSIKTITKEADGWALSIYPHTNQSAVSAKAHEMIYDQLMLSKWSNKNSQISTSRAGTMQFQQIKEEQNIPLNKKMILKKITRVSTLKVPSYSEGLPLKTSSTDKNPGEAYKKALIENIRAFSTGKKVYEGRLLVDKIESCTYKDNQFTVTISVNYFQ